MENYNADIIVGELWGVSKDLWKATNNKGISAVYINSVKGLETFKQINEKIEFQLIDSEKVIKANKMITNSILKNKRRARFFEYTEKLNVKTNIKKNLDIKNTKKIKNFIKEIAYKTKTYNLIKNIVK